MTAAGMAAVLLSSVCIAAPPELAHSSVLDKLAEVRAAKWLPLPIVRTLMPGIAEAAAAQLFSPDATVRRQAAFLLGEAGRSQYARQLKVATQDPDRRVRLHAGIALARMGSWAGLHQSLAALTSAAPWLRYYAAIGLWRLGFDCSNLTRGQEPLVAKVLKATGAPRHEVVPRLPQLPQVVEQVPSSWQEALDLALKAFTAESDWWWHKGDYDQVVRANEVIVFLAPDAVETYSNSAWLLWSMGRHTQAIGTYHRGIANNPDSSSALFYLGFYYFQHGLFAEAEPYLRRATQVNPTDHLARRALAHCLEKQGRRSEALEQWEILKKQRPTDGSVALNISRIKRILALMSDP